MPCAAEFAPALASLCRLPFVAHEVDNDERVVRPDATGDALCCNPLLARAAGIVGRRDQDEENEYADAKRGVRWFRAHKPIAVQAVPYRCNRGSVH